MNSTLSGFGDGRYSDGLCQSDGGAELGGGFQLVVFVGGIGGRCSVAYGSRVMLFVGGVRGQYSRACGSRSWVGCRGSWVSCRCSVGEEGGRSWVWSAKGKAAIEVVVSVRLGGSDSGGVGGLVSCSLESSKEHRLILFIDRRDRALA